MNTKLALGIVFVATVAAGSYWYWQSHMPAGQTAMSSNQQDSERRAFINELGTNLDVYYSSHGHYPADAVSISEDKVDNLNLAVDPVTGKPYPYTVAPDGSSFTLCAILSTRDKYCISNNNGIPRAHY